MIMRCYLKIANYKIIAFFIGFITLFPLLFGATEGAVLSYAILTLGLLFMLLIYILKFYRLIDIKVLKTIFFLLVFSFLIILIPTLLFSKNWIINDFFEIHRPILYSLIFLLPLTVKWTELKIDYILKIFFLIVIFNIVFSILQPLGLIDNFSYYYAIPRNYFYMHRSSGTFPAPYDLGYVFTLVYLFFVLMFVYTKKIIYAIFTILSVFTVILTQSKTAMLLVFISTAILIFVNVIFMLSSKTKSLTNFNSKKVLYTFVFIIFAFISVIAMSYAYLYENYSYLVGGLELFLSGQDNSTLDTRFSQSRYILQGLDNNILTVLFGNGINKDLARYLESYYIMYQFRYGLVGIIFTFILFYLLPIYFSYKSFINTIGFKINILFHALFIWYLITPIGCIGNSFVDIPRVNFIYFFFFGLSYYFSKKSNVEKFNLYNNPII